MTADPYSALLEPDPTPEPVWSSWPDLRWAEESGPEPNGPEPRGPEVMRPVGWRDKGPEDFLAGPELGPDRTDPLLC